MSKSDGDLPESNFVVEWKIDLAARDHEQAARRALAIQQDPTSQARFFSVRKGVLGDQAAEPAIEIDLVAEMEEPTRETLSAEFEAWLDMNLDLPRMSADELSGHLIDNPKLGTSFQRAYVHEFNQLWDTVVGEKQSQWMTTLKRDGTEIIPAVSKSPDPGGGVSYAELSTILAALRHFQDFLDDNGPEEVMEQFVHFADVPCLSATEIDRLCDRLNSGEITTGGSYHVPAIKSALPQAYAQLHDFVSDMIEDGRLRESDIPDDYQALVTTLTRCVASTDQESPAPGKTPSPGA